MLNLDLLKDCPDTSSTLAKAFISNFQTETLPKLHLSFTVAFLLLHADCTSTHNHTKILIAEKWCSRSVSSSDSFATAAFPSHTHYSHTHKSLRASGASVMLLCRPGALSSCSTAAHSQHSETAHMEGLLRVSLSIKVPLGLSEGPLKTAVSIAEVKK